MAAWTALSSAVSYSYYLDLLLSCFCAIVFGILLSLDAWNAFKRKASWFPGQALVLSAPIIQLLSFIDNLKLSPHSDSAKRHHLLDDQVVISSRRIMICVIIGYLLPGMGSSSATTLGSNFGALSLSIIMHMSSELYFTLYVPAPPPVRLVRRGPSPSPSPFSSSVHHHHHFNQRHSLSRSRFRSRYRSPRDDDYDYDYDYDDYDESSPYEDYDDYEESSPSPSPARPPPPRLLGYYWIWDFWEAHYNLWFKVSWVIVLTVIILFMFLLGCALLSGKSIRNTISRNVPLALSCCGNAAEGHQLQRHSIGDHVLKSWIVVRVSQPDYIMARSVFSSFVGVVVTVCLVFLVGDWVTAPPPAGDVRELITHVIQFVFIIIGWFIISIRWLMSVMYFPRDLRSLLHWEDFWTSNIVGLKADLNARYRERLFRDKRLPKRAVQENGIMSSIIAIRLLSFLLTMVIWLEKLMVLLSKACGCLSEIVFRMIRPVLFGREMNALLSGSNGSPTDKNPSFNRSPTDENPYQEALEIIRMPGETAYSLWAANKSAFKKVEKHMKKGFKQGKDSSQLIKLKEHRTGDPHSEAAVSVKEEEYFQQLGKMSWKMKAVSLIRFMIFYYEDCVCTDIDDAIQAYCQAWPLMNIVDTSNPEANLVSQAADEEFDAIEDIWKKHMKSIGNPKYSHSKQQLSDLVEGKMKKGQLCQVCEELGDLKLLSDEQERKARKDSKYRERFHDNKEWMKSAAAKSSLYKTRKALGLDRAHSMGRLKSLLANVIFSCIDVEVDKAIIKNCNKCAQEGNEIDIYEVAFVAGIAEAVKTDTGELQVKVDETPEEGSQIFGYPEEIIEIPER